MPGGTTLGGQPMSLSKTPAARRTPIADLLRFR